MLVHAREFILSSYYSWESYIATAHAHRDSVLATYATEICSTVLITFPHHILPLGIDAPLLATRIVRQMHATKNSWQVSLHIEITLGLCAWGTRVVILMGGSAWSRVLVAWLHQHG